MGKLMGNLGLAEVGKPNEFRIQDELRLAAS